MKKMKSAGEPERKKDAKWFSPDDLWALHDMRSKFGSKTFYFTLPFFFLPEAQTCCACFPSAWWEEGSGTLGSSAGTSELQTGNKTWQPGDKYLKALSCFENPAEYLHWQASKLFPKFACKAVLYIKTTNCFLWHELFFMTQKPSIIIVFIYSVILKHM